MQVGTWTVLCEHSKRRKRMEQRSRNLISFSVFKQIFNRKTYISFPLGVPTRERKWRKRRAYACGCKKYKNVLTAWICANRAVSKVKRKNKNWNQLPSRCSYDKIVISDQFYHAFVLITYSISLLLTLVHLFTVRSLLRREHWSKTAPAFAAQCATKSPLFLLLMSHSHFFVLFFLRKKMKIEKNHI